MAKTADLQQFTEQQIEEYCKHADDGEAVQIIRQLMGECPRYAKSHNVDEFYD